jgi:Holliday junction resolvase RusA-like endonuclease
MNEFSVTVYGLPGPQGSKSPKGRRRNGSVILVESSKKVKPWRAAIVEAASQIRPAEPFDGPLVAELVFTMPRPKVHYREGKFAGQIKARYLDALPDRVPDLSKLIRSTEDALTDAGVWADDARVVAFRNPRKVYVSSTDPDALDRPGAIIRVGRFVTCSRERSREHLPHVPVDVRYDVPLFVLAEPGRGPS